MTVSFVLRLVAGPDPAEIRGEVEDVLTGERTLVRSTEELTSVLSAALAAAVDGTAPL